MRLDERLSDSERELYEAMSDISKDYWSSGWIIGTEFALWAALHGDDQSYDVSDIDRDALRKVAALSAQTGMWIIWRDDAALAPADQGPYPIALREWTEMYSLATALKPGR